MTEVRLVESLTSSSYNPPERVLPEAINRLRDSIERRGIIVPLVVTADGHVVDGHRRLACAKALGLANVPVIVVDDDASIYAEMNETTRRYTPAQWLLAYSRGAAVPERIRVKIEKLAEIVGRDGILDLAERRVSPAIYDLAMYAARYCEDTTPEFIRTVIAWLLGHRSSFAVRRAISDMASPLAIVKAIKEDRDLSIEWR